MIFFILEWDTIHIKIFKLILLSTYIYFCLHISNLSVHYNLSMKVHKPSHLTMLRFYTQVELNLRISCQLSKSWKKSSYLPAIFFISPVTANTTVDHFWTIQRKHTFTWGRLVQISDSYFDICISHSSFWVLLFRIVLSTGSLHCQFLFTCLYSFTISLNLIG